MVQNQNQGYQPIDESKVNWDQIEEKFGISKEVLERTGAKDNMLNFGKSGLLDVTMLIYDQKVKAAARLQLTRLQDGRSWRMRSTWAIPSARRMPRL